MSDPFAPRSAETPQPLPTPAEIALLEAHGFARCTARGCEWPDKYCTENAAFENALELLRAVRAAVSAPHPQPARLCPECVEPVSAVTTAMGTMYRCDRCQTDWFKAASAPAPHPPEPLVDWFSAKKALLAGIDACGEQAYRCALAARNTSDEAMDKSAESWRVSAAVIEAFIRQHEGRWPPADARPSPQPQQETK